MGLFDRFTSKKGKDQTTGPKRGVVKASKADKAKEAEKKAFASVGGAKEETVKAKAKTEKASTKVEAPVTKVAHVAQRVLIRPIVTEKSTRGGAQAQYTFEVATTASKPDVLQAVFHLYGVMPVTVNVLNMHGKVVRFGRTYGRTNKRKKAVVTLPAGKTIDVVNA